MDKIEILPVALLEENRSLVNELKALASTLGLEFGWHYLLDLTWIISALGDVNGKKIMDAGAGTGVLQWYLAQKGATVFSVDRASRADLPWRFRRWTEVRGWRPVDLNPSRVALWNVLRAPGSLKKRLSAALAMVKGGFRKRPPQGDGKASVAGRVWIYNQDLRHLSDIPDNSLDAVAALSALEHNPPDQLPQVVAELLRVIKPGGLLLATLGASREQDWFHQPSQGWCYSEMTLRRAFDLPQAVPSNYARYDQLFEQLRNCTELKENLARFYFRSGDNGMPWGVWDPQYQSVGVVKVKR
ncbi:MAG: methyltransferase domain-containing protein [Chloroflexota bacterium]